MYLLGYVVNYIFVKVHFQHVFNSIGNGLKCGMLLHISSFLKPGHTAQIPDLTCDFVHEANKAVGFKESAFSNLFPTESSNIL